MMCSVTKVTPIHFIDGKCNIKQLKSKKSQKTSLFNHTRSMSHHIMPLVINAIGGGHTYTHILMHEQRQFQETRCTLATGQHTFGL